RGSSFKDMTSTASPTTSECLCIRDRVMSRGGYYVANTQANPAAPWNRLEECNGCAFGVRVNQVGGATIGNTDIRDLINDSISRFARGGRVGAEGVMPCNRHDDQSRTGEVKWAIF